MKFHLDADRRAIQDSIARTLQAHCTPERRRASMDSGVTDGDLWRALMDVGFGALWAPESHAGAGLGVLEMALAMEAIGAEAAPGPFLPQAIAIRALAASTDDGVKEAWLPDLVSGARKAALCVGDPWTQEAEAPPAFVKGTVTGAGGLALGAVEADVFLVRTAAGSLVLVEKSPLVATSPIQAADLTRPLGAVAFDNAPALLVADAPAAASILDAALVLTAADALGGAQRCLDMAVAYAKTREQFGVVIGQFQALKHQLAQMALEVEPARALLWYAAHALDAGLPGASRAVALAKAHLADRFTSVSRAAIEAHGGIGYTWDYDLQIWFRRALFDRAWLGAPSVHRERAAVLAGW